MGIALGQMGMDIQSFYQLTPEEFEEIYTRWSELRDSEFRNSWEQTRCNSYWSIKASLKNVTMQKFMPLPWDKTKDKSKKTKGNTLGEKAHDLERFERLKKKYGSTI
jgi:hypothetical protein